MIIPITIYVDVDDLDIDYIAEQNSLTSEYWGSVRTDNWVEIDLRSVTWDGHDVDLDDNTYDDLLEYLAKQGETL